MSNLLNSRQPKKKLLDRGPKINPAQQFTLDEIAEDKEQKAKQEPKVEAKPATKAKRRTPAEITSVRVTKNTRNKLNALIQMGKAESVDVLIDILLDEYIDSTLVKDEKKTFDIVVDIIKKRDN